MHTSAVIMQGPRDLAVEILALKPPQADDIVVKISHSGISTGTEKLFWTGEMPPFPGMGYPLVPGYDDIEVTTDKYIEPMYAEESDRHFPLLLCYIVGTEGYVLMKEFTLVINELINFLFLINKFNCLKFSLLRPINSAGTIPTSDNTEYLPPI